MKASEIGYNYSEKLNTHYVSVEITSGNTTWAFLKTAGGLNFVTCRKVSANPFGMLGKEFESFDQAQENYKAPLVKSMILFAESLLDAKLKTLVHV